MTLEDLFEKLLPAAIQAGMDFQQFWDSTYKEIIMYIQAYNRREENKLKTYATMVYRLADIMCPSIARLLSEKAQYPKISAVFPGLFPEEESEEAEEAIEQNKTMHLKAVMTQYMIVNNNKEFKE